jgi:PAS domain S-box-containing protein
MRTLTVPAEAASAIAHRADTILAEDLRAIHVRTDRLFARLMVVQWLAGIGAALWITPKAWIGPTSSTHIHVWTAVLLGAAIVSLPIWLALRRPGETRTRHAIGIGQMLASALLIHLTGGRIETHFHVFGSLALLAFYRDWKVLVSASAVVALDHFLRGLLLPQSVYGILAVDSWRWLEHAGWVAFEDAFLIRACFESAREMREIAERRATLEQTNDIVEALVVERTSQVEESEERHRRLFEDDITGNALLDASGRILACNSSFARMFGFASKAEAVGAQIAGLHARPEDWHSLTERLRSGQRVVELEMELKRRDEKPLTVITNLIADRGSKGESHEIRAYYFDITERKRLEKQFLRTQRLESIGTLAGGIAHDLNNVLTPIMLGFGVLKLQEGDPQRQALIANLAKSTERGANMVGQLLSFARGVDGSRQNVDIGQLLDEVARILNDTFLKSIEVHTQIAPDLWTVTGDPTQLHQVILNLCVNARDAMPSGGSITLSAENVTLDQRYVGLNPETTVGPYVTLSVEDTGCGIAKDILDKIFDPFFTTKEVGKGTGLGLSTSLGIVRSHGGFIRVYSEPGKGSKFQIHLPANAIASVDAQPRAAVDLPRGNGKLVLVVDDEELVRIITKQTLEEFGYRVLLAADGAEAVAEFSRRKDEICVVLTDMMMPVMDGPATIHALMKLDPDVRIVAASGLHQNDKVAKATSAGVRHFLLKPYTAETLVKTLDQALHGLPVGSGRRPTRARELVATSGARVGRGSERPDGPSVTTADGPPATDVSTADGRS